MFLLLLRLFVCLFLGKKSFISKIIVSALKQNYLTIRRPAFVSDDLLFLHCDVVCFVLFVGE